MKSLVADMSMSRGFCHVKNYMSCRRTHNTVASTISGATCPRLCKTIWNYESWSQGRRGNYQLDQKETNRQKKSGFTMDLMIFQLKWWKNNGFSAVFPDVHRSACWWHRDRPRAGGMLAPFGAADSDVGQVETFGVGGDSYVGDPLFYHILSTFLSLQI